MKELIKIQAALKAPKGQYNSFGGYAYRSCEDILEAVKPILAEQGCCLVISDEVVYSNVLESEYIVIAKNPIEIQSVRTHVKATATIINSEGVKVSVSAYARESAHKTGMDSAQLTGATSSYARKYALNGLFCIDDAKDADATNDHGKGNSTPEKPPLNKDGIKSADGRKYVKGFDSPQAALDKLAMTRTLDEVDRALVSDIWHAEREPKE